DLLSLLVPLALAFLVTSLHLILAVALKRPYIGYWAIGWSMLALQFVFQHGIRLGWPSLIPVQHGLGSLAAFGFGFCLFLGCRHFAAGKGPSATMLIFALLF